MWKYGNMEIWTEGLIGRGSSFLFSLPSTVHSSYCVRNQGCYLHIGGEGIIIVQTLIYLSYTSRETVRQTPQTDRHRDRHRETDTEKQTQTDRHRQTDTDR
jgi:hypothetical protein